MVRLCSRSVIVFVVCALTLGCGAGALNAKNSNDLKVIGLAFHNFSDANTGKAPTKAEDLDPYLKDIPDASKALKDGKVVFLFGVSMMDILKSGTSTSETVLAYEKDVPAQGGLVLLADGSVRKMSAAEFKTAKKATPASK
jgi:hypothetical protein